MNIKKAVGLVKNTIKVLKNLIDTDYYINHQILPASLRILKVLGVDEERLLDV
jgi:DNA polymerase elongation subunit (family B)